jgi:hypothetical protein
MSSSCGGLACAMRERAVVSMARSLGRKAPDDSCVITSRMKMSRNSAVGCRQPHAQRGQSTSAQENLVYGLIPVDEGARHNIINII